MKALLIVVGILALVLTMPVIATVAVVASWLVLPIAALWLGIRLWQHHTSPQQRRRRHQARLRMRTLLEHHGRG